MSVNEFVYFDSSGKLLSFLINQMQNVIQITETDLVTLMGVGNQLQLPNYIENSVIKKMTHERKYSVV